MKHSLALICLLAPLCYAQYGEEYNFGGNFQGQFRERRQHQIQQHAGPSINYQPYNQAPDKIKQLLHLQQARQQVVPVPAIPAPSFGNANQGHQQQQQQAAPHQQPIQPQLTQAKQVQSTIYRPQITYNKAAPQQPQYNQGAQNVNQYAQQNHQYNPQYQQQAQQQQHQQRPQYHQAQQQPIHQQYQEPRNQYSNNLPPELQQLLQIQAHFPAPNAIPLGDTSGKGGQ